MTIVDRSGPGVRITLLDNERAPSGEPLDLAGRIIAFTYEDAEKKADQVSLQLDNFDLARMREAVALAQGRALLEASGGLGLDQLRAVAATGVDRISVGKLTKDVRAIDYSMRVI